MAPQRRKEFVVLKLTYSEFMPPQYTQIKVSRKKRSPSGSMPEVKDWFDRVMANEKSNIRSNVMVRYCEFHITSSNEPLFTIMDCRFDNMLFILGEESVHWILYLCQHKRIDGCVPLSVNYCSCCFQTQILTVMESIKSTLRSHQCCEHRHPELHH